MNTPSPTQSPGALEEASSPKSRVRITVLTILALHVVVIGGLLLQGCDRPKARTNVATNSLSGLPSLNTDSSSGYFTNFPGDTVANPGAGAGSTVGGSTRTPSAPGSTGAGTGTLDASGGAGSLAGGPSSPAPSGSGLPPVGSSTFPPLAPGSQSTASPGQATEHTVKAGDTIGALAKKYHVTEKSILEANPTVKPRSLKVDTKLVIPPPSTAVASGAHSGSGVGNLATNGTSSAGTGEVYVVKAGDNLGKIARKFGITVKQLREANNIKGDRIVAQQKLNIPPKAPAAVPAAASGTAPAAPRPI